jgi:HlyD family secretion protein
LLERCARDPAGAHESRILACAVTCAALAGPRAGQSQSRGAPLGAGDGQGAPDRVRETRRHVERRVAVLRKDSYQSGQVLREPQESERVVLAGSPLFEIGNAADLDVVVELLSSDAVRVRSGADATIESTGLEGPIQARVRLIELAGFTKVSALGIEEQRVRVFLDIETPAEVWKRLGHDYRVFARVTVWSSQDTLRVPLSALFRRGDGWAVYRMESGRAALTMVDVGHRNSDFAEVMRGLKPQDIVVLHPNDRIVAGTRISRRGQRSAVT